MHADDSTMFSAVSTCKELNKVLCSESKSVSDWAKENKTSCIVFGTRGKLARDSHLNHYIEEPQYCKLEKCNYLAS